MNHVFFPFVIERITIEARGRVALEMALLDSNQSAMPGVNMPKSQPLPATRPAKHQCLATPMPIPAFDGPMRWRLHVFLLGCPQPSPMGQGPATTR